MTNYDKLTEGSGSAAGLLRHREALEFIDSIKDPITRRLVMSAQFFVLKALEPGRERPVADFDVRFFVGAIEEFCQRHDILRSYLNGERVGEWWDEE
jgi:hypothetical protein